MPPEIGGNEILAMKKRKKGEKRTFVGELSVIKVFGFVPFKQFCGDRVTLTIACGKI